ncbi:hypothetical protein HanIR_Chr11g0518231 [Helianthus annuus]|nr:hypothetical protein HanIR_Chr11g0518231 [Helianthus annuus]
MMLRVKEACCVAKIVSHTTIKNFYFPAVAVTSRPMFVSKNLVSGSPL